MNSSLLSNTSLLIQLSITLVHEQLKINLVFLVLCLLNCICCLTSLKILLTNKTDYNSRTFAYIKLFFVNELILSMYGICVTFWHIFNATHGHDEVYSKRRCFSLIGLQSFLVRNQFTLNLLISIDRLTVFVKMIRKKLTIDDENGWKCTWWFFVPISLLFSMNILLQISSYLDKYDETLILFCSLKESYGEHVGLLFNTVILLESWLTFFIYIFLLTLTKCKLDKIKSSANANNINNKLTEMKLRDFKRLSKVVSYSTIIYFLTGIFAVTAMTILNRILEHELFIRIITWLVLTLGVEGIFNTTSLLLTRNFGRDFRKMIFGDGSWCQNQVGSVQ